MIITGASGGIGAVTARLFAKRGWTVVLAARSEDKLAAIVKEISALGGTAHSVVADVTVQEDLHNLVRQTVARFGRIDVLVNNAGAGISGTLESINVDQLAYIFALNVVAPVAALQAVVPTMKAQRSGIIVNVSSLIEDMAVPYMSGYGASKAALGYLSDAAAIELASYNISVVKVLPGMTKTEFGGNLIQAGTATSLEELFEKAGVLNSVTPDTVAETIWQAVQTPRRKVYVTLTDKFVGNSTRLAPGVTNLLLKAAIQRYAPIEGQGMAKSVRQDLNTAALATVGVAMALVIGVIAWREKWHQKNRRRG
ncbi:MAG: SDR family NAD(P)-dependent oxidoreductase [Anaerolineae bacterium]|nr:SDR family NAD(P)-dependent oxidoreductase [Anaerolineae bacterium]